MKQVSSQNRVNKIMIDAYDIIWQQKQIEFSMNEGNQE